MPNYLVLPVLHSVQRLVVTNSLVSRHRFKTEQDVQTNAEVQEVDSVYFTTLDATTTKINGYPKIFFACLELAVDSACPCLVTVRLKKIYRNNSVDCAFSSYMPTQPRVRLAG